MNFKLTYQNFFLDFAITTPYPPLQPIILKRNFFIITRPKSSVFNLYRGLAHFPNKSLCVPVRVRVSTNTSSSIR